MLQKMFRKVRPWSALAAARALCSAAAPPTGGEAALVTLLRTRFPAAAALHVEDISGGCGAMYAVHVETAEFAGMSRLRQHRAVQEALSQQIKDMHGIRVSTAVPPEPADRAET
ncbi:bolA-like protein 3 isoform X2 [Amphibalanus amphitrite]|nr:bolA-like protein 3 isoform X2 [Amphibalanus amphitrite]XP_043233421.1 bolA-like protein 3 isoform X2 [Amphibalanus amphitrite]